MTTAAKARTRHTMLTTEAFRELAETALEELIENSATLEMKDLLTWQRDLKRTIGRVSDHQYGDALDPAPLGRGEDADEPSAIRVGWE